MCDYWLAYLIITMICIVLTILTITLGCVCKQIILQKNVGTVAQGSVLFSKSPARLVIWTVEMRNLPVWTLPPEIWPSTQALPWGRLLSSFLHGPVLAHTVFCTKNALCILGALCESCFPLRSTETTAVIWNKGHGPSGQSLPVDLLFLSVSIWSSEGLKEA